MKHLLSVLALSLSFSAFASQKAQFRNDVNCTEHSRRLTEARATNVQKIAEDEANVTFQFQLSWGGCSDRELVRAPLIVQKRSVSLTKYGLNLPWYKDNHKLAYEAVGEDTVQVTASFNKLQKKFIMEFWPQKWDGFSFVLSLKDSDNGTILDLEGFDPL